MALFYRSIGEYLPGAGNFRAVRIEHPNLARVNAKLDSEAVEIGNGKEVNAERRRRR